MAYDYVLEIGLLSRSASALLMLYFDRGKWKTEEAKQDYLKVMNKIRMLRYVEDVRIRHSVLLPVHDYV